MTELDQSDHRVSDLVGGFAAATPERDIFTIRDLAKEFGVSARTLRFYEEKGLLDPTRRGEQRLYTRRDRARLAYVLAGKTVGFSLEEVREMLDLYDLGDGQSDAAQGRADKIRRAHRAARAAEKRHRPRRRRTDARK